MISYFLRYELDMPRELSNFIEILVWLIVVFIIYSVVRKLLRKRKNKSSSTTSAMFMTPPEMGLRGKTKEQKKVIKYFMSTGILGMIFRISDSTFDKLLDDKANEIASQIEKRALETHGMDADEVKEIPPILADNYYPGSRYLKMFRDHTFRASEYEMTYLMFSERQMYSYKYIFDLTSAETDEQTKEYFYKDITNVEVTKTQREFPAPRPLEYIVGGIAGIIIGILLMMVSKGNGGVIFLGSLILIVGIIISAFLGYSRRVVDNLILRLTVAGDEFVCAMNPDNISAIQGMKAKINEKKK